MADDLAKLKVILETETAKYKKGLEKVDKRLKRFEKRQKSALNRIKKQWNGLAAGVGAYLSIDMAARLLRQADAMAVLDQRIRTATAATGDYEKVSKSLFDISQKNGVALAESVSLFQNLSIAAKSLGKSTGDVLKLSEAVQQLGILGGSSQEALNNSLRQFSQAMAGGIVRAEEFNSIIENTPLIAQRIAEGMGETVGSLRLAVIEGRVLSKDVFEVLQQQAPQIAKEFEAIPPTLSRSLTQLNNAFDAMLARLDKAGGITQKIAEQISAWARVIGGEAFSKEEDRRYRLFELAKEEAALRAQLGKRWLIDRAGFEKRLNDVLAERTEIIKASAAEDRKARALAKEFPEVQFKAEAKKGNVSGVPLPEKKAEKYTPPKIEKSPFDLGKAEVALLKAEFETLVPFFEQLNASLATEKSRLSEIDALEASLQAPLERLQSQLNNHSVMIENARADDLISEERYQQLKTGIQEKYEKQRSELIAMERSIILSNAAELFDGLSGLSSAFAGEQSGIYRAMFAVSKAFAIADSIVKIQSGIASAANMPFPANISAMAMVASQTAGIVSNIKAVSFDGARALGGPVETGKTYLVGEKGPELLTMGSAGNVTPNNKISGETKVTINNYGDSDVSARKTENGLEIMVKAATSAMFAELETGGKRTRGLEKRLGWNRRGS